MSRYFRAGSTDRSTLLCVAADAQPFPIETECQVRRDVEIIRGFSIAADRLRAGTVAAVVLHQPSAWRPCARFLRESQAVLVDLPLLVMAARGSIECAILTTRCGGQYLVRKRLTETLCRKVESLMANRRRVPPLHSLIEPIRAGIAAGRTATIGPTARTRAIKALIAALGSGDLDVRGSLAAMVFLRGLLDVSMSRRVLLLRLATVGLDRDGAEATGVPASIRWTDVHAAASRAVGGDGEQPESRPESHCRQATSAWVHRAQRVVNAVHGLCHSEENVSQLAYACGYGHHSAFCRDFRLLVGMSPTAFRRHWHRRSAQWPIRRRTVTEPGEPATTQS